MKKYGKNSTLSFKTPTKFLVASPSLSLKLFYFCRLFLVFMHGKIFVFYYYHRNLFPTWKIRKKIFEFFYLYVSQMSCFILLVNCFMQKSIYNRELVTWLAQSTLDFMRQILSFTPTDLSEHYEEQLIIAIQN